MIYKRPHQDTKVNICRYLTIDQLSCFYHINNNFEVSNVVKAAQFSLTDVVRLNSFSLIGSIPKNIMYMINSKIRLSDSLASCHVAFIMFSNLNH